MGPTQVFRKDVRQYRATKELLESGLRGTDLPALIMIGKGEDKGR